MKLSELQTVLELQQTREELEAFIKQTGSEIRVELVQDQAPHIYAIEIQKHPGVHNYAPSVLTRILGPMISAAITAAATDIYEEIVEKYGVEPG